MNKLNRRQNRKIGTRASAIFFSLVLALSALTGCGGSKESETIVPKSQKGRYVEEEITLPEEWTDSEIRQIMRINEELHLLLQSNHSGNARLQEMVLNEDGSFTDVTQEWLDKLSFPYEEYGLLKLMQDAEGTQYLYACYSDAGEDFYKGHLWRSDGKEAIEITPEKWKVMEEQYGFYDYPRDITLTEAGILVSFSYLTMDCISAEDGSLLSSAIPDKSYGEWIASVGENLYRYTMDSTGSVDGIEICSNRLTGQPETIPFSQEQSGYTEFDILEDGTIIAAHTDGFFQYNPTDKAWKKVIPGSDTSFAFTDVWCTEIAALSDGTFYAVFGSDEGTKLMQYLYDPEATIQITETLTLYTVSESYLLQQAAALYHREHPEILIEIETAFSKMESYTSEPDYQQIYQELNTELMAGNGADILVLDGLDMETYASKGLLTDIEDVVAPLEENGTLLANVTELYRKEDGNRYAVPLQFGLTFVVGRGIKESDMESMDALANYLAGEKESYLGPQTISELVDKFYPFFATEIVQNKELQRDVLAVRLEQLKKIADNCGILVRRDEDNHCYNIWDIASRCQLAFYEADGFNQSMLPISAANFVNGSFTCFEQAFQPHLEISINSKSEHQETAKDFLRFALSEEVQSEDYYEGFPVNTISLGTIAAKDRSNAEACTTIEIADGMQEEFSIKAFSKEDAQRLVEKCKTASVRLEDDIQIRSVLIDVLPAYLEGSSSLEETMDAAEGGLKMYLAE